MRGTTMRASQQVSRARRVAQHGFTLIELLMVMVIAIILLAVAAPSMSEMIANQRVKGMAGDLHLALVRTRSEAIKRNTSVTLSPATGGWANGWSIADPTSSSADPLLVQAGATGVTVTTSMAAVTYNGTGRTTTGSGSFVLGSSNTTRTRCVSIDTSGRPSSKEASTC
jgi:type IV fimbrial biogenesis protein FimT